MPCGTGESLIALSTFKPPCNTVPRMMPRFDACQRYQSINLQMCWFNRSYFCSWCIPHFDHTHTEGLLNWSFSGTLSKRHDSLPQGRSLVGDSYIILIGLCWQEKNRLWISRLWLLSLSHPWVQCFLYTDSIQWHHLLESPKYALERYWEICETYECLGIKLMKMALPSLILNRARVFVILILASSNLAVSQPFTSCNRRMRNFDSIVNGQGQSTHSSILLMTTIAYCMLDPDIIKGDLKRITA